MKITRMGIDLAKTVFQLHGVNASEKVVVNKSIKRKEMLPYFAQQSPMLIGLEACAGAHYWGRELSQLGHEVRLMAPQHVKAYVKSHKNDRRDAEAICEAVSRPTMRFVEKKSVEQQDIKAIHCVQDRLKKSRTALINEMRGLLLEYGIVLNRQGVSASRKGFRLALEDAENGLSEIMREILHGALEELNGLDDRIADYQRRIECHAKTDERAKRLLAIEGIGPITASAIVAEYGNGQQFTKGRSLSANLGIVPNQHSSGGKERLGNISKRGNKRLRTLLIHGARSVIRYCEPKTDARSEWIKRLIARSNKNVAAVALANKNARIIWALLSSGEEYRPAT